MSFVQPQDLRDALFDRFHYVRRRSQAIEGFGAFFDSDNSDIELFVRTYVASLRATRCDGKRGSALNSL